MEDLKRRAEALDDDVKRLTAAVDRLDGRMDRSDRDRRWFVTAIVVVAIIVCGVGYVAFRAEQTSRALAQTAREQETIRNDVLCPLYGLILGGYNPESRPEGDARRKYEDTFVIIRQSYGVLHCTSPLVPPRAN